VLLGLRRSIRFDPYEPVGFFSTLVALLNYAAKSLKKYAAKSAG
jgi:hypothetical protein